MIRLTEAGEPCRVAVRPDTVHGALRARHHYGFGAAGRAVQRAGLRALIDGERRTPAAARGPAPRIMATARAALRSARHAT